MLSSLLFALVFFVALVWVYSVTFYQEDKEYLAQHQPPDRAIEDNGFNELLSSLFDQDSTPYTDIEPSPQEIALETAQTALATQDYHKAKTEAENLLNQELTSPLLATKTLVILGKSELNLQNIVSAKHYLEKAEKIVPNSDLKIEILESLRTVDQQEKEIKLTQIHQKLEQEQQEKILRQNALQQLVEENTALKNDQKQLVEQVSKLQTYQQSLELSHQKNEQRLKLSLSVLTATVITTVGLGMIFVRNNTVTPIRSTQTSYNQEFGGN